MMKSSGDSGEVLQKLKGMEVWVKDNGFDVKTRQEIRQYFYSVWSPKSDDNYNEYFDDLPMWLRTKAISSIMKNSKALNAFIGMDLDSNSHPNESAIIKAITSSAVPMHIKGGVKLFEANDDADYLYLLDEGEMGAVVPGDRIPFRISSPGVVGSGAIFSDEIRQCAVRPFSVFTLTSCFLWRIKAEDLWIRLLGHAPSSLVHILERFLESIQKLIDHIEARDARNDVFVDKDGILESCKEILEDALHLKAHLSASSQRAIERKELESNTGAEDGSDNVVHDVLDVRHKVYSRKVTLSAAEDLDESSSQAGQTGPTNEDLLSGRPLMPVHQKQKTDISDAPKQPDSHNLI